MKTLVEKSEDLIKKDTSTIIKKDIMKSVVNTIPFVGSILTETMPALWAKAKQSGFNDFLIGINNKLLADKLNEKDIEKFKKKLEQIENYQYLSTIIDSVFFSKSKTARILLGIITASYINKETISYEDLIIISALKDLLDDEIDVFIKFFLLEENCPPKESGSGLVFVHSYNEIEKIILSKLKKLGVFSEDLAGNRLMSSDEILPLRYVKSIVAEKMYAYVLCLGAGI